METGPIAEVWQAEEGLWQCCVDGDAQKFMSFYADSWVGWQITEPLAYGKAPMAKSIEGVLAKAEYLQYLMTDKVSNQPAADLVNVYYRVSFVWRPAPPGNPPNLSFSTQRVHHVWQKQADGSWQMVGGMGAYDPKEPDK